MRVAVVINPAAGPGGGRAAGPRRAALAARVLAAEGAEPDVRVTAGPGDAAALSEAAVARGASLVVAWGGDGTVNEVGAALAFTGTALGIVPGGSGNGLARELGVPRDPGAALRAAVRGGERVIDAGEVGGRLFFVVAGIGLDAWVAARVAAAGGRRRGLHPYVTAAARALWTYRPAPCALDVDGDALRTAPLLVACANARQWGHGVRVAPAARLDDGALDLVVVEDRPPLARLWAAGRALAGRLDAQRGVLARRFRRLTVSVEAPGPLAFHADGEPGVAAGPLVVRVRPGALRVRAPARPPRPRPGPPPAPAPPAGAGPDPG
jgi:YegS/Rv2252/BmrU family lipid kinase